MALRVLLADESHTIKKVIQLSLQDYAVEVKSVNLGVDVIEVAKTFKPDIVFADVLLQKRNGYEVAHDIKNDPELQHIPVVLMWSGFIEVDNGKFAACKANEQLEKPFEVENLREIIQRLVPKTGSNDLGNYLKFPKMPVIEEQKPPTPQQPLPTIQSPAPNPTAQEIHQIDSAQQNSRWNMNNFEDPNLNIDAEDEFEPVQLDFQAPETKEPSAPLDTDLLTDDAEEDNEWVQTGAANYKMDIAVDDDQAAADDDLPIEHVIPEIDTNNIIVQGISDEQDFTSMRARQEAPGPETPTQGEVHLDVDAPQPPSTTLPPKMSEDEVLKIVKAQSQEVIEKVVWQVVPELATQIIERELNRLLKEKEQSL